MTVNITVEHNEDLLHLEVPVSWESDERGEGWVMDYSSGDRAFDDVVERLAFAKADQAVRDSSAP
jgi:hypothetical protein